MILVVGYGISGKGCMALLEARGMPAIAVDKNPALGALLDTADFPLQDVAQVILSPGIPPSHPIVQRARKQGIEVIGEMEFAMRHVPNRCVGITGSNGKTTTALLAAHALSHAGVKAKAVGNVGVALSSYLLNPDPREILIIELSSFQLETMRTRALEIAVVLNLTPNHMDRYASMSEYAQAKANIQHCLQTQGRLLISSQIQREYPSLWSCAIEVFDAEDLLAAIYEEEYTGSVRLPRQNICAARAIAAHFGVSQKLFAESLKTFRRPPHRMEWVAERNGICYYNDSKATSVEAVLFDVALLAGPLILIAGGVHKGSPYQPWAQAFRGKVKHFVVYGEAGPLMQEALAAFYPLDIAHTLAEAVARAKELARAGDTVMLAPGCSSYDQFQNYEQRGDTFKQLVLS